MQSMGLMFLFWLQLVVENIFVTPEEVEALDLGVVCGQQVERGYMTPIGIDIDAAGVGLQGEYVLEERVQELERRLAEKSSN